MPQTDLPLRTVTIRLSDAMGLLRPGMTLIAELSSQDTDGDRVVHLVPVEAVLDEDGGAFALWPNTRGLRGTNYKISARLQREIIPGQAFAREIPIGRIQVDDVDDQTLGDLLNVMVPPDTPGWYYTMSQAEREEQLAAFDAAKEATAADRVQTGLDVLATTADKTQTALDRVATGEDVVATAADRVQTGLDVAAAAAVLDGTIAAAASIGMYSDATLAAAITAGLAVATEGQTFHATGLNVDYVGVYKDVSGAAVEQAKLPKSSSITAASRARYAGSVSGNLLRWSRDAIADWIKSTALATFEGSTASDGAFAFRLAHTSAANVSRNIKREAGQTSLSYRLQLDSKTGGTGGSPGRVLIQEIEEPQGAGASGFTVLATTTIVLPSGNVSVPVLYQGTIALNAATKRLVCVIDLQGATEIKCTEPVLAWGSFVGLILPRSDQKRELDAANWPMARGFDPLRVTGPYFGMTGAVSGTSRYYINDDGDIQITTGENSVRLWRDGKSVHDKSAFEVSLAATVTGADTGAGALIGIGEIDGTGAGARKIYGYLRNGFIGVLDNNNATEAGGVVSGMAYAADERVSLRVFRNPDGSGYIEATSRAGAKSRVAVAGIPSGSVAAAWRRATTGLIHRLNVLPVSAAMPDIENRVESLEAAAGPAGTALLGFTLLPDSAPARVPGGFTCTGIDRITRGKYAGCWIIGDDGRLIEGDGSPLAGKVHVVTPDFGAIVATFDLGLVHSVQGVAVDTSGAADTVWLAVSTNKTIRHFDMDGVEIVPDRIDWAAEGYSGDPNGLAYDPTNHALWVATVADATVRRLECDPGASPKLIDTHTLEIGIDQLHFDDVRGLLYYTTGGNGSDGSVGVYRLSSSAISAAYGPLTRAQAIEGMYVDRATSELIITNDGGFHNQAAPALNVAIRYRVALLS